MKQKLLLKTMLLLFALIAGSSSVWADTAGFTLASSTSAPLGAGDTKTTTISGNASETWNVEIAGTWTSSGMSGTSGSKYWQMGANGAAITSATFSTSGITGTITSVVVNCASYQAKAKVNCTVGGNNFGTQNQSTPSWSSNTGGNVTFSGSASGAIVVTIDNSATGARAAYIQSITVTYTPSSKTPAGLAFDPTSVTLLTESTATVTFSKNTTADASFNIDEAVATYNSSTGELTAVAEGSTSLVATTEENATYQSGYAACAVTVMAPKALPFSETFASNIGTFSIIEDENVTGFWKFASNCMKASAYISSTNNAGESWIVSPYINLSIDSEVSFEHADQYFNSEADMKNECTLWIREYGGNWEQLTITTYPVYQSGSSRSEFVTNTNNLSSYTGKNVQFGFKYLGNSTKAGSWFVKNFVVESSAPAPTFTLDITEATLVMGTNNTVDVKVTTNTDGAISAVSDHTDIATVALKSGKTYTITAVADGTATITISSVATANYKQASATVAITVQDPTKKGTISNPYSVAEVINGTATGNNVYVRGFIVGEFVGSSSNPRTSGFTGNSNLAVADAFSSSPVVGDCIPVELPSSPSSIRTNWGLQNNPSNVGYQILFKGNVTSYFSVTGIKGTNEVTAISVPVTIAGSGYSTIAKGFGLDFANAEPAGLEAYIVPSITASTVSLSAIDEAPASTGVILKGTAGETYTIPVKADAAAVGTNKLQAAVTATAIDANAAYILQGGLFHLVTAASTVPAGKAYLLASDIPSPAPVLNFSFGGDDTTSIDMVKGEEFNVNGEFYNLNGQRVAQPTKGLYIVNGKKVVIK